MDYSQVNNYINSFEKKNNIQDIIKENIHYNIGHIFPDLSKKHSIKYELINISSEYMYSESVDTVQFGQLNLNLYERELINFEDNCIFVVIYIPSYNSETEYKYNNRFKNPIFQLFRSVYINEYNYLNEPFISNDNVYIEILKFEETIPLQTIVIKTIEYIKYSIKSRIKVLEIEIDNIKKEQVFEDTYLQNEIQFHKVLEKQYELIMKSVNMYCFDLISTLAIEIDTDDLFIRNIDLENIEIDYKNNKISEIIEEFRSDVPDINTTKQYISNEDLYCVLLNECEEDIDYITEYVKLFCNNKNFIDCTEILTLLETKKGIIEAKIVELEKENEKENDMIDNDMIDNDVLE